MLDPRMFHISPEQAQVLSALPAGQLDYAYALRNRQRNIEAAKAHAEVLASGNPGILERLTNDDYDAMAQDYESQYTPNEPEAAQMDDAVWRYIQARGAEDMK